VAPAPSEGRAAGALLTVIFRGSMLDGLERADAAVARRA
jgi:hypothetical protein